MCLSECTAAGNNAFSLTTTTGRSQVTACQALYLGFMGGLTIGTIQVGLTNYENPFLEKYCGSNFHPGPNQAANVVVCCKSCTRLHHRSLNNRLSLCSHLQAVRGVL